MSFYRSEPLRASDYIVGATASGEYMAKANPATGYPDVLTNTNATSVFQTAINNLRGSGGFGGGVVEYTSFFYPMTSSIVTYPGIEIRGPARNSAFANKGGGALQPVSNMNAPVILVLLDVNNTTQQVFANLRDVVINGLGAGPTLQDGIQINNNSGAVLDVQLDHVGVFNVGGTGINCLGGTHIWMEVPYVENCGLHGIATPVGTPRINRGYIFQNSGVGMYASGCTAFYANDVQVWSNRTNGLVVFEVANIVDVHDCHFDQNGTFTTDAVVLQGLSGTGSTSVINFNDNVISDGRASGVHARTAIALSGTAGGDILWGVMQDNAIRGTYQSGAYSCVPSIAPGMIIKNNKGLQFGKLTGSLGYIDNTHLTIGLGNTSTANASQDYIVANYDILINAANSSNSDNSITIKDNNGNAILTGLSVLSGVYVPAGYKINWGAFTGTFGAITVFGI